MKTKILIAVAWILLGTFNFGTWNVVMAWNYHMSWADREHSQRDYMGLLVVYSYVFPPAGLLAGAVASNFWQHGWSLSSHMWDDDCRYKTCFKNDVL